MKIIDFPKGLTFHVRSGESNFLKEQKKIFNLLRMEWFDPCCSTSATTFPVRFNTATGNLERVDTTGAWVEATSNNIESSTTGITAHAGGGQGSAVALTTQYNEVTTVATAADSVKLPAAVAGTVVIVKNDGVTDLAVFPATGDTIDDAAANASVTVPVGETLQFNAVNSTNWETSEQTLGTSNGTAAAPSMTFASDSDTGFYRATANTIGLALGGVEVAQFNPTQLSWLVGNISAQGDLFGTNVTASGIYTGPAGTVSAPEYTFTGDLDTGMYHVAANQLGFAANGVLQTVIDTTGLKTSNLVELVGSGGITVTGQILAASGTAAAPGLSFSATSAMGLYNNAGLSIGFGMGGSSRMELTNVGVLKIDKIAELTSGAGVKFSQPIIRHLSTQKALNSTGAITAAELATGLVTTTSAAAVTGTLPTASLLASQLGAAQGSMFEFIVDNSAGANTFTVAVNTGITVGTTALTGGDSLTVSTAQVVGVFRLIFTSATAAILRRIA